MATADGELDQLWRDFHTVVNMTSRELRDWLMTDYAGDAAQPIPDQMRDELGWQVLEILGKRRSDVTGEDVQVMAQVVDFVRSIVGEDADREVRDDALRRQLMDYGHDPLKPVP